MIFLFLFHLTQENQSLDFQQKVVKLGLFGPSSTSSNPTLVDLSQLFEATLKLDNFS